MMSSQVSECSKQATATTDQPTCTSQLKCQRKEKQRRVARRGFLWACLLVVNRSMSWPLCSCFQLRALSCGRSWRYSKALSTRRATVKCDEPSISAKEPGFVDRRGALLTLASVALLAPTAAVASSKSRATDSLEELWLGQGRWTPLDRTTVSLGSPGIVPPAFCTYLTRFMIHNDAGVNSWWRDMERKYSLLPSAQSQLMLSQSFASLARSMELALEPFLLKTNNTQASYEILWDSLMERYTSNAQQSAILFALLPHDHQPTSRLKKVVRTSITEEQVLKSIDAAYAHPSPVLSADYSSLLPPEYHCVLILGSDCYTVEPAIPLYEVGIDGELGKTTIATSFGPLSSTPLIRENPRYSLTTYSLFGLCGAAGCALTHAIVIPIDVVKTRNQVDPGLYKNFLGTAVQIFETEGLEGLLLGAQATIVGYCWYGLSVYPSYTLFKRALTLGPFLTPEVATLHANDIALVAGALAAVVASLGLTPLEAARIRVVADPDKYRPLGLLGTLSAIAGEDNIASWRALYAGLPSLLARQVIFGSVKFLAFERACDFIFDVWPTLRDATWTSLMVSLVAGGLSGALSSVVSQPADSILTYVNQNSDGSASKLGVIEGCRVMVQQEGLGSLFRGLNSRIIWAGSIIAGQFLLYDIFRTFFGVNTDDLSQVYQIVIPTR